MSTATLSSQPCLPQAQPQSHYVPSNAKTVLFFKLVFQLPPTTNAEIAKLNFWN